MIKLDRKQNTATICHRTAEYYVIERSTGELVSINLITSIDDKKNPSTTVTMATYQSVINSRADKSTLKEVENGRGRGEVIGEETAERNVVEFRSIDEPVREPMSG